jgi:hypothetical protein
MKVILYFCHFVIIYISIVSAYNCYNTQS